MSRRFAGAGLSRRPARGGGGASAATTPFSIFGANLVHEWDAALSTITIATGVSSISDLRGGKNLAQGTGALQPSLVSAGLQSYLLGSGTQWLRNITMSLSGDVTLLVVGRFVAFSGNNNLATIGTLAEIIRAPTSVIGIVTDSSGSDSITGPARDTAIHSFAVRNATAVARKLYVDGGSGASGARTLGMNASTEVVAHARQTGADPSNSEIYWMGIVATSPSLANLNLWGAWANARFGTTWSTAT
jgi:hypothetical protein